VQSSILLGHDKVGDFLSFVILVFSICFLSEIFFLILGDVDLWSRGYATCHGGATRLYCSYPWRLGNMVTSC
jgi:hypothetical protein